MSNKISLAMSGGLEILNPTPVDNRMRTDSLALIVNDATYYIGYTPILSLDTGLTYYVSGGDEVAGWVFAELIPTITPGGSDKTLTWEQITSSEVWTIQHDLNKDPAISVLDSAGSEVVGHIEYESKNKVILTFTSPFKGVAILN